MNFGKGFFCRVGLSLATATAVVAALIYAVVNIDTVVEKIRELYDSLGVVTEGFFHTPGVDLLLIALVSFVFSLTIVMWYVENAMSYDVQKSIINDPNTFTAVTAFLAILSVVFVIVTCIFADRNVIYLWTFVPPFITFLVILQYEAGCYKKVCRWITKQD